MSIGLALLLLTCALGLWSVFRLSIPGLAVVSSTFIFAQVLLATLDTLLVPWVFCIFLVGRYKSVYLFDYINVCQCWRLID